MRVLNRAVVGLFASVLSFGVWASSDRLFQVGTAAALSAGAMKGAYSVKDLKKRGNFGIGLMEGVDGEMIAFDGRFYRIDSRFKRHKLKGKDMVAFAQVTNFEGSDGLQIKKVDSYAELKEQLVENLISMSYPYAIKIEGDFKYLKVRAYHKHRPRYPLLAEAAERAPTLELKDVKGTIIGFWFPEFWHGVSVGGFHFHFVDSDLKKGGHVLDLSLNRAFAELAEQHEVTVMLPQNETFAEAEYTEATLEDLNMAEGTVVEDLMVDHGGSSGDGENEEPFEDFGY